MKIQQMYLKHPSVFSHSSFILYYIIFCCRNCENSQKRLGNMGVIVCPLASLLCVKDGE